MARGGIVTALACMFAAAASIWWVSASQTFSGALPVHEPDLENGETLFWIGGCASCHAADDAKGDAKLLLGGGHRLKTPFGTFVAPNISPDPEHGIGGWSVAEFVTAMRLGTAPDGRHYYPSFPYGSYTRMGTEDLIDLKAFLDILPASDRASEPHELPLPLQWRRPVGLWKALFLDDAPILAEVSGEELERGRYLVEGPGHCGECHTRRNLMGGLDLAHWLAGAPNPAGKGSIPNVTPHAEGLESWSEADIVESLTSGFTPEYDTLGGSMTSVVENTSRLSQADREAIAAYLKAVPAQPDAH